MLFWNYRINQYDYIKTEKYSSMKQVAASVDIRVILRKIKAGIYNGFLKIGERIFDISVHISKGNQGDKREENCEVLVLHETKWIFLNFFFHVPMALNFIFFLVSDLSIKLISNDYPALAFIGFHYPILAKNTCANLLIAPLLDWYWLVQFSLSFFC